MRIVSEQFVLKMLRTNCSIYTKLMMKIYFKRIRALREDHDLTQAQVGAKINLPQRTYAYYERGERMIPPQVLIALADLYQVSVDYILERSDDPKPCV